MRIVWNRITRNRWTAMLPPDAGALQQSFDYGAAVQGAGGRVMRAEIMLGRQTLALAQVVLRRWGPLRLAYLPRGPVWLDRISDQRRSEAMAALRRAVPGWLLLAPEASAPVLPLMTGAVMAEWVLGPEPAMRAALRQKWRNRLCRAEAAGLHIETTAPDAATLAGVIARDLAQQVARGYRALPPAFLTAWPPGAMRLIRARLGAEVVAEALFLDHAPGVSYQIGWTGAAGRSVCAQHLVLWRAACDFADRGRRRLDLGTLDTVTAPGLARFKLGTGAIARQLGAAGPSLPSGSVWPMARSGQAWQP